MKLGKSIQTFVQISAFSFYAWKYHIEYTFCDIVEKFKKVLVQNKALKWNELDYWRKKVKKFK